MVNRIHGGMVASAGVEPACTPGGRKEGRMMEKGERESREVANDAANKRKRKQQTTKEESNKQQQQKKAIINKIKSNKINIK